MKTALVFGAGRIGRGFVGQLLFRSGYTITFVDPSRPLVDRLNAARGYSVTVLSSPPGTDRVTGLEAIWLDDGEAVLKAIARHNLFFTAVGGANLPKVGELLATALARRFGSGARGDVNVVLCENWKDPAADLRRAVEEHAADPSFLDWTRQRLGIVESQILRPTFEPEPGKGTGDPLELVTQDWWTIPCDGDAFRGPPPPIKGLEPRAGFRHELIRKVYSYNCMNAAFAYLGYLRGHVVLNESATDPVVREAALEVWGESNHGLTAEYGFPAREQDEIKVMALRKYEDARCPDPIERNARDTQRKLLPKDRILGPAARALKHGKSPAALALVAAAALHYDGSRDPGTLQVQGVLREKGLRVAVEQFCGVGADSVLGRLIIESVPKLERFNRRGITLAPVS